VEIELFENNNNDNNKEPEWYQEDIQQEEYIDIKTLIIHLSFFNMNLPMSLQLYFPTGSHICQMVT
jgi:hypothetical protein